MSQTFIETVTLEKKNCGSCGGVFALNQEFVKHASENAGGYTCPYCKTRWGWTESNEDRLRKQLAAKERELSEAKCSALHNAHLRDQESKARQEAEKKLRRVDKGVCPCCNRSFTNLRRHMKTKHPEKTGASK